MNTLFMTPIFCYAVTFLVVLLVSLLYTKNNRRWLILYGCATIAALFNTNEFYTFFCLELMAIASTFVIFYGNGNNTRNTGYFYLKAHILGGTLLLIGISMRVANIENAELTNCCILAGLLVNLAIPPLSSWLIDGYENARPADSIMLSVGTTKISLIILAQTFSGYTPLICIGILMCVYGLIYAAFERNFRRIINFFIISELGIAIITIGLPDIKQEVIFLTILNSIICIALVVTSINFKNRTLSIVCNILGFASIYGLPFTIGSYSKNLLHDNAYLLAHPWLQHTIAALYFFIGCIVVIRVPYYLFAKKEREATTSTVPMWLLLSTNIFLLITLPFMISSIKIFDLSIAAKQIALMASAGLLFAKIKKYIFEKEYHLPQIDSLYRVVLPKIYHFVIENLALGVQSFTDKIEVKLVPMFQDTGARIEKIMIRSQAGLILLFIIIILAIFNLQF